MQILRLHLIWLLCLTTCTLSSTTSLTNPGEKDRFAHPFVASVAVDIRTSRLAEARQRVAEEVGKKSPHPFAPYLHAYLNCFSDDITSPVATIARLQAKGWHRVAISKFPSTEAAEIPDVWSLYLLGMSAIEEQRPDIAFRYAAELLTRDSEFFGGLAILVDAADFVEGRELIQKASGTASWAKGDTARFLEASFPFFADNSLEVARFEKPDVFAGYVATKDWLENHPHDALARYRVLDQEMLTGRLQEALQNAGIVLDAFPFFDTYDENPALVKTVTANVSGDVASAKQLAEEAAPIDFCGGSKQDRVDRMLVYAAYGSADYGWLDKFYSEPHPDLVGNPWFWQVRAQTASYFSNAASATAYWSNAVSLDSDRLDYRDELLGSLNASARPDDILEQVRSRMSSLPQLSPSIYEKILDAAMATGNQGTLRDLIPLVKEEYPMSPGIRSKLVKAHATLGEPDQALAELRMVGPPDSDEEWDGLLKPLNLDAGVELKLRKEMRDKYPWRRSVWGPVFGRIPPSMVDAGVAEMTTAMGAVEPFLWPYAVAIDVLRSASRYDEALKLLAAAEKKSSAPMADRLAIMLKKIEILLEYHSEADPESNGREALEVLERYRSEGGDMRAYFHFATLAYRMTKDENASIRAHAGSMLLGPHDMDAVWKLVTEYQAQVPQAWWLAHRYLTLNPYEPRRYRLLIQLHVMYGGSPIIALALTEKLRSFAPERVNSSHEGHAWGALGDTKRSFDLQYADKSGIGNSTRYVEWFRQARDEALSGGAPVRFDPNLLEVSVDRPWGEETWRVHPISGKVTYLKRGDKWLKADYDPQGIHLLKVTDSTGHWMNSVYDSAQRVVSIHTSEMDFTTIAYDPDGSPQRISSKHAVSERPRKSILDWISTPKNTHEIEKRFSEFSFFSDVDYWRARIDLSSPFNAPLPMPLLITAPTPKKEKFVPQLSGSHVDELGAVEQIVVAGPCAFILRSDGSLQCFGAKFEEMNELFANEQVSTIAPGADGQLLFATSAQVGVLAIADLKKTALFEAPKAVNRLLKRTNNEIWAISSDSAFRWKNQELTTFGPNNDQFPSETDMLANIFETTEGKLWVVGSNEDYRQEGGQKLVGGVLEFTGESFRRLDEMTINRKNWFATGYTPIGKKKGIVGTTKGFMLQTGESIDYLNLNPSYLRLSQQNKALWLGTSGAQVESDTWVFGSAGGLVLYRSGSWFDLEDLNKLLPQDGKFGGKWGIRSINAVAAGPGGWLFVGTSRGMLSWKAPQRYWESFK